MHSAPLATRNFQADKDTNKNDRKSPKSLISSNVSYNCIYKIIIQIYGPETRKPNGQKSLIPEQLIKSDRIQFSVTFKSKFKADRLGNNFFQIR